MIALDNEFYKRLQRENGVEFVKRIKSDQDYVTTKFDEPELLGYGRFATTWKIRVANSYRVAKICGRSRNDPFTMEQFEEIVNNDCVVTDIIRTLDCRNLVLYDDVVMLRPVYDEEFSYDLTDEEKLQHIVYQRYVTTMPLYIPLTETEAYRNRSMTFCRLCKIAMDICDGGIQLHSKRIVHRDIHPSNILYDRREDCYKLTDYGSAVILKENIKRNGLTTAYAKTTGAHEGYFPDDMCVCDKFSREFEINRTLDTYQTGKVLWELLKVCSDISYAQRDGLEDIIEKATSQIPRKRYDSFDKLKADISFLLQSNEGDCSEEKGIDFNESDCNEPMSDVSAIHDVTDFSQLL